MARISTRSRAGSDRHTRRPRAAFLWAVVRRYLQSLSLGFALKPSRYQSFACAFSKVLLKYLHRIPKPRPQGQRQGCSKTPFFNTTNHRNAPQPLRSDATGRRQPWAEKTPKITTAPGAEPGAQVFRNSPEFEGIETPVISRWRVIGR